MKKILPLILFILGISMLGVAIYIAIQPTTPTTPFNVILLIGMFLGFLLSAGTGLKDWRDLLENEKNEKFESGDSTARSDISINGNLNQITTGDNSKNIHVIGDYIEKKVEISLISTPEEAIGEIKNRYSSHKKNNTTPFLIGVVIDLSKPMMKSLHKISSNNIESSDKITKALNLLVKKAIAYCKTPESRDILPRFSLFVYGFGLGTARKAISNFLERLGVMSESHIEIPTENVRDLLEESATRQDLPVTPNASQLNQFWEIYRQSLEAQILDMGDSNSSLIKALEVAEIRIKNEMKEGKYQNPILLVISSGKFTDGSLKKLISVSNSIKQSGIELIFGYIGDTDMASRTLYAIENPEWNNDVKCLFKCASELKNTGKVATSISQIAKEKSWIVPTNAKLLLQFNHQEMLDELMDIITSPLR